MRVVITTVQVPFIRGGAEILAEGLRDAIRKEGHQAEIVAVPFKWYPPALILDHMLACRLFDLTESNGTPIDRVIGLKFPAYLIPHPNKVLWLVHQHRTAYELWDSKFGDLIHFPDGKLVRDAIRQADERFIPECKHVYTIACNVSKRLKAFCRIDSTPIYNPPSNAEKFYAADYQDYLYFPSRLTTIKRQDLVLAALAKTRHPVRVKFAGAPDHHSYYDLLLDSIKKLNLGDRVELQGMVSDADKLKSYANALAVVYPPSDEDYGYVTLEAMLAARPVITCTDSGGPLEFVEDGQTGFVTEPTPAALAEKFDQVWKNRDLAKKLGTKGRERYQSMKISWKNVVERLLS
ncbi:MAG: glycosyltransferase family 4 protein [Ignavibacteriae bacterium]|nr:glycosyltransferase family 4 protein [Ignavibacteria bacterium]MBI3364614.1 glycosyltransferase family 4 protein [Ignavibacteriota bacterium]